MRSLFPYAEEELQVLIAPRSMYPKASDKIGVRGHEKGDSSVNGYTVYLLMNMLHASVSQGIARESTPCKRHLKRSDPRFCREQGRGVCLPSEVICVSKTGV